MRIYVATALLLFNSGIKQVNGGFQWDTPWNVSNLPGSDFTLNPDYLNGGSFSGSGSAHANIQPDGSIPGITSTNTIFTRTLTLTDSPNGWLVDVQATALGQTIGLHGTGTIFMEFFIDSTLIFWGGQSSGSGGTSSPFSFTYPDAMTPPLILMDGTYTLTFRNTLSTSFPGPPISGPGSVAAATNSYNFSIAFTPTDSLLVPVPPSGIAFCAGMMSLAVTRTVRRQTKRRASTTSESNGRAEGTDDPQHQP